MLKLIKRYSGKGWVFRDDKELSTVSYDLALREDRRQGTLADGSAYDIPGLQTIDGRISADQAFLFSITDGQELTLRMDDGSRIKFFLSDSTGRIATTGGIY